MSGLRDRRHGWNLAISDDLELPPGWWDMVLAWLESEPSARALAPTLTSAGVTYWQIEAPDPQRQRSYALLWRDGEPPGSARPLPEAPVAVAADRPGDAASGGWQDLSDGICLVMTGVTLESQRREHAAAASQSRRLACPLYLDMSRLADDAPIRGEPLDGEDISARSPWREQDLPSPVNPTSLPHWMPRWASIAPVFSPRDDSWISTVAVGATLIGTFPASGEGISELRHSRT